MTFLVSWAYEHGHLPSEVLEHYKTNRKDFTLLAAYAKYSKMKHDEAMEEAKRTA